MSHESDCSAGLGPPVEPGLLARAASACALLSDPARVHLLHALPARPDAALAARLRVTEDELAQHVRVLVDAGVAARRDGVVHLRPGALSAIAASLRVLFEAPSGRV